MNLKPNGFLTFKNPLKPMIRFEYPSFTSWESHTDQNRISYHPEKGQVADNKDAPTFEVQLFRENVPKKVWKEASRNPQGVLYVILNEGQPSRQRTLLQKHGLIYLLTISGAREGDDFSSTGVQWKIIESFDIQLIYGPNKGPDKT